jgi:hypothetical protein
MPIRLSLRSSTTISGNWAVLFGDSLEVEGKTSAIVASASAHVKSVEAKQKLQINATSETPLQYPPLLFPRINFTVADPSQAKKAMNIFSVF